MSYRQFLNISFIVVFTNVFKSVGFDNAYAHMNVSFVGLYFGFVSMFSLFNATMKSECKLLSESALLHGINGFRLPLTLWG